jgi:hypothetical protein
MMTIAEALSMRSIPEPNSGCHLWLGAVDGAGYGIITRGGIREGVHRAAWALENGPVPLGLVVCHHCDVPLCVNPAHLFLGTKADNSADMARKGRWRGGAPAGGPRSNKKLTEGAAREVILSSGSLRHVARRFGVAPSLVFRIRANKSWKHIDRAALGTMIERGTA